MKIHLAIIFLSLIWAGYANAEKIALINCTKENGIFNREQLEKTEKLINKNKQTIKSTIIFKTDYAKKNKHQKVLVSEAKLNFVDKNYATKKIIVNGKIILETIYDLNEKNYETIDHGNNGKVTRFFCE